MLCLFTCLPIFALSVKISAIQVCCTILWEDSFIILYTKSLSAEWGWGWREQSMFLFSFKVIKRTWPFRWGWELLSVTYSMSGIATEPFSCRFYHFSQHSQESALRHHSWWEPPFLVLFQALKRSLLSVTSPKSSTTTITCIFPSLNGTLMKANCSINLSIFKLSKTELQIPGMCLKWGRENYKKAKDVLIIY